MEPALETVVADFLYVIGLIAEAASLIHDDASPSRDGTIADPGFARDVSDRLAVIVDLLGPATADHVHGPFIKACRRVGRDLHVHVDRALLLHARRDGQENDITTFRRAWPEKDVAALGVRLDDLIGRWKEAVPTFVMPNDLRLDSLSHLKIESVEADEKEEEEARDEERKSASLDSGAGGGTKPNDMFMGAKTAPKTKPAAVAKRHAPVSLLEDFILDSLSYQSMRDREEEVTAAHDKTFEWIFASDGTSQAAGSRFNNDFMTWLTTGKNGPIYWINGKPGSGKSTLMRFLFEHDMTMKYLEQWAGAQVPVVKAGFFFWTSGSRQQRSQTGLLRYLLHQLLSENRSFMGAAFPELWAKLLVMTTKERVRLSVDWTVPELMRAFNLFLETALKQMKVCLFIDGLDEFEGDHREIIHFFRALGEGPNSALIKMCLSSRPWDVFEKAFQYSVPSLRLQDLTYQDMHTYADDRLKADARIRRLGKADRNTYATLVQETIRRADGVFLWVRLALNKLLEGMQPGDTLSELGRNLAALPTELDDLFEKALFKDQTDADITETASLFELIQARELVADFIQDESSNSLTIWELTFALHRDDDDDNDNTTALALPVQEASDEEIARRCETTRTHIHARFAGLLDLFPHRDRDRRSSGPQFALPTAAAAAAATNTNTTTPPALDGLAARALSKARVTYIHRTVRDYLVTPAARAALATYTPTDFDAHVRLLRSYVLRLRLPLEEPEHHRRLDEWWPDIALAMTHARHARPAADAVNGAVHRLVGALNAAVSWYWRAKIGRDGRPDTWAEAAFGSYEVRMKAPIVCEAFLCLAVKFGVADYVMGEVLARGGVGETGMRAVGKGREREQNGEYEEEEEEDGEEEKKSTPLLSYATEFLCSRKKTVYPLSDPALVSFLLSHPSSSSSSSSGFNPGPNHEYTDFNLRVPMTPWLALLRHLRDAQRRGWIEYYDTNPDGTERWAAIVKDFVKYGADVGAVVVADAWDPEISALGVVEMLEQTYGVFELRERKEEVRARLRERGLIRD